MHPRFSVFAALLIASIAFASSASAAVAPGPRLAFVEWLPEPPMTRLATVAADGSGRSTLPLDGVLPAPFEGPAWSADGSTLVFGGYPVDARGEAREGAKPRLFVVGAEGGVAREVPGSAGGSGPVLSADGATVAFSRSRLKYHFDPKHPLEFGLYASVTTWTVPLAGGRPERLTPWRNGLSVQPAAFSPDGSVLLMKRGRRPGFNPEVIALDLGSGGLRLVARQAEQPSFSPDGTRIALISYRDGFTLETADGPAPVGEVYVLNADGTQPKRLTRTKGAQESQPSWSPSGERIAFVRTPGPGGLGFGSTIFQVNAEGSCSRRVAGSSGRRAPAFYGPAWQPGLGREAVALSC